MPKKNGFTFIEIIIVLAIISIVSTFGIAAFSDYSQRQAVNTAALEVFTMLDYARASASSQVKPTTGVCTANRLDGYRFTVIAPSEYKLEVVCSGYTYALANQDKTLPQTVAFSSSAQFDFPILKGGIQGAGVNGSVIQLVHTQNASNKKTITVYSDGRITLN